MARSLKRGITLPVNSVIIIALAIFVLLMIAAFFGKSSNELTSTQVNTAFNQGCSQLSTSYNCNYERVHEISTNLVVGGQAKTLLDVCRISFNNPSMSAFKCKKACQVCPNRVYDGSPCEFSEIILNEDCISPLTPEDSIWQCMDGTNPSISQFCKKESTECKCRPTSLVSK